MNSMSVVGRLGADPQAGKSQRPMAKFRLAEPTHRGGEKGTQWHSVVVWGKPAEACLRFLQRGSMVYVSGHVVIREFEGDQGPRMIHELHASEVTFLANTKGSGEGDRRQGDQGDDGGRRQSPRQGYQAPQGPRQPQRQGEQRQGQRQASPQRRQTTDQGGELDPWDY
jgi:single stranded DNA-binding protein